MTDLRLFSYLPNPRLWKATITARLCGVSLDIRGAKPGELADWLWDFEARPLTDADRADESLVRTARAGFSGGLRKTDAFVATQPFGTVPAAFSPDGKIGIYESNSIMRAVARLDRNDTGLYGRDPYEAARIDSFLDASLVFARDAQIYLLAIGGKRLNADIHERTLAAFTTYLTGTENALRNGPLGTTAPTDSSPTGQIAGATLTLADICFVCELALFWRERVNESQLAAHHLPPIVGPDVGETYPLALAHFHRLRRATAFAPDTGPYLKKLGLD